MSSNAPLGEIYNVGLEFPTPIVKVVQRTAKALNKEFNELVEISEDRLGRDSKYWLDSTKIKEQLGWKQQIFWDEGLSEMANWGEKFASEIRSYSPEYVMRG